MFLDDHFKFFWIKMIALILDQVLETGVEAQDAVFTVMAEITSSSESVFGPVYYNSKVKAEVLILNIVENDPQFRVQFSLVVNILKILTQKSILLIFCHIMQVLLLSFNICNN
jgi:hypothetical protein